jgi:hypothetical protein
MATPTRPTSAFTMMPIGSSSLQMLQKENQPSGHQESIHQGQGNPEFPLRPLAAVPLAERNLNGKHPQTHEENPGCLIPALAKKPSGGVTGRGTSRGHTSSKG